MNKDWCKFFKDIEANPSAIVPDLTIRDLYLAKHHLYNCDNCWNVASRVLDSNPNKNNMGFQIGEN